WYFVRVCGVIGTSTIVSWHNRSSVSVCEIVLVIVVVVVAVVGVTVVVVIVVTG
ncbi:unnamed protein product, partial [Callosobruchus maculatus]